MGRRRKIAVNINLTNYTNNILGDIDNDIINKNLVFTNSHELFKKPTHFENQSSKTIIEEFDNNKKLDSYAVLENDKNARTSEEEVTEVYESPNTRKSNTSNWSTVSETFKKMMKRNLIEDIQKNVSNVGLGNNSPVILANVTIKPNITKIYQTFFKNASRRNTLEFHEVTSDVGKKLNNVKLITSSIRIADDSAAKNLDSNVSDTQAKLEKKATESKNVSKEKSSGKDFEFHQYKLQIDLKDRDDLDNGGNQLQKQRDMTDRIHETKSLIKESSFVNEMKQAFPTPENNTGDVIKTALDMLNFLKQANLLKAYVGRSKSEEHRYNQWLSLHKIPRSFMFTNQISPLQKHNDQWYSLQKYPKPTTGYYERTNVNGRIHVRPDLWKKMLDKKSFIDIEKRWLQEQNKNVAIAYLRNKYNILKRYHNYQIKKILKQKNRFANDKRRQNLSYRKERPCKCRGNCHLNENFENCFRACHVNCPSTWPHLQNRRRRSLAEDDIGHWEERSPYDITQEMLNMTDWEREKRLALPKHTQFRGRRQKLKKKRNNFVINDFKSNRRALDTIRKPANVPQKSVKYKSNILINERFIEHGTDSAKNSKKAYQFTSNRYKKKRKRFGKQMKDFSANQKASSKAKKRLDILQSLKQPEKIRSSRKSYERQILNLDNYFPIKLDINRKFEQPLTTDYPVTYVTKIPEELMYKKSLIPPMNQVYLQNFYHSVPQIVQERHITISKPLMKYYPNVPTYFPKQSFIPPNKETFFSKPDLQSSMNNLIFNRKSGNMEKNVPHQVNEVPMNGSPKSFFGKNKQDVGYKRRKIPFQRQIGVRNQYISYRTLLNVNSLDRRSYAPNYKPIHKSSSIPYNIMQESVRKRFGNLNTVYKMHFNHSNKAKSFIPTIPSSYNAFHTSWFPTNLRSKTPNWNGNYNSLSTMYNQHSTDYPVATNFPPQVAHEFPRNLPLRFGYQFPRNSQPRLAFQFPRNLQAHLGYQYPRNLLFQSNYQYPRNLQSQFGYQLYSNTQPQSSYPFPIQYQYQPSYLQRSYLPYRRSNGVPNGWKANSMYRNALQNYFLRRKLYPKFSLRKPILSQIYHQNRMNNLKTNTENKEAPTAKRKMVLKTSGARSDFIQNNDKVQTEEMFQRSLTKTKVNKKGDQNSDASATKMTSANKSHLDQSDIRAITSLTHINPNVRILKKSNKYKAMPGTKRRKTNRESNKKIGVSYRKTKTTHIIKDWKGLGMAKTMKNKQKTFVGDDGWSAKKINRKSTNKNHFKRYETVKPVQSISITESKKLSMEIPYKPWQGSHEIKTISGKAEIPYYIQKHRPIQSFSDFYPIDSRKNEKSMPFESLRENLKKVLINGITSINQNLINREKFNKISKRTFQKGVPKSIINLNVSDSATLTLLPEDGKIIVEAKPKSRLVSNKSQIIFHEVSDRKYEDRSFGVSGSRIQLKQNSDTHLEQESTSESAEDSINCCNESVSSTDDSKDMEENKTEREGSSRFKANPKNEKEKYLLKLDEDKQEHSGNLGKYSDKQMEIPKDTHQIQLQVKGQEKGNLSKTKLYTETAWLSKYKVNPKNEKVEDLIKQGQPEKSDDDLKKHVGNLTYISPLTEQGISEENNLLVNKIISNKSGLNRAKDLEHLFNASQTNQDQFEKFEKYLENQDESPVEMKELRLSEDRVKLKAKISALKDGWDQVKAKQENRKEGSISITNEQQREQFREHFNKSGGYVEVQALPEHQNEPKQEQRVQLVKNFDNNGGSLVVQLSQDHQNESEQEQQERLGRHFDKNGGDIVLQPLQDHQSVQKQQREQLGDDFDKKEGYAIVQPLKELQKQERQNQGKPDKNHLSEDEVNSKIKESSRSKTNLKDNKEEYLLQIDRIKQQVQNLNKYFDNHKENLVKVKSIKQPKNLTDNSKADESTKIFNDKNKIKQEEFFEKNMNETQSESNGYEKSSRSKYLQEQRDLDQDQLTQTEISAEKSNPVTSKSNLKNMKEENWLKIDKAMLKQPEKFEKYRAKYVAGPIEFQALREPEDDDHTVQGYIKQENDMAGLKVNEGTRKSADLAVTNKTREKQRETSGRYFDAEKDLMDIEPLRQQTNSKKGHSREIRIETEKDKTYRFFKVKNKKEEDVLNLDDAKQEQPEKVANFKEEQDKTRHQENLREDQFSQTKTDIKKSQSNILPHNSKQQEEKSFVKTDKVKAEQRKRYKENLGDSQNFNVSNFLTLDLNDEINRIEKHLLAKQKDKKNHREQLPNKIDGVREFANGNNERVILSNPYEQFYTPPKTIYDDSNSEITFDREGGPNFIVTGYMPETNQDSAMGDWFENEFEPDKNTKQDLKIAHLDYLRHALTKNVINKNYSKNRHIPGKTEKSIDFITHLIQAANNDEYNELKNLIEGSFGNNAQPLTNEEYKFALKFAKKFLQKTMSKRKQVKVPNNIAIRNRYKTKAQKIFYKTNNEKALQKFPTFMKISDGGRMKSFVKLKNDDMGLNDHKLSEDTTYRLENEPDDEDDTEDVLDDSTESGSAESEVSENTRNKLQQSHLVIDSHLAQDDTEASGDRSVNKVIKGKMRYKILSPSRNESGRYFSKQENPFLDKSPKQKSPAMVLHNFTYLKERKEKENVDSLPEKLIQMTDEGSNATIKSINKTDKRQREENELLINNYFKEIEKGQNQSGENIIKESKLNSTISLVNDLENQVDKMILEEDRKGSKSFSDKVQGKGEQVNHKQSMSSSVEDYKEIDKLDEEMTDLFNKKTSNQVSPLKLNATIPSQLLEDSSGEEESQNIGEIEHNINEECKWNFTLF